MPNGSSQVMGAGALRRPVGGKGWGSAGGWASGSCNKVLVFPGSQAAPGWGGAAACPVSPQALAPPSQVGRCLL